MRSDRLFAESQLLAGSAISLMLPKAVTGWFAAGTDGQLWVDCWPIRRTADGYLWFVVVCHLATDR